MVYYQECLRWWFFGTHGWEMCMDVGHVALMLIILVMVIINRINLIRIIKIEKEMKSEVKDGS